MMKESSSGKCKRTVTKKEMQSRKRVVIRYGLQLFLLGAECPAKKKHICQERALMGESMLCLHFLKFEYHLFFGMRMTKSQPARI